MHYYLNYFLGYNQFTYFIYTPINILREIQTLKN